MPSAVDLDLADVDAGDPAAVVSQRLGDGNSAAASQVQDVRAAHEQPLQRPGTATARGHTRPALIVTATMAVTTALAIPFGSAALLLLAATRLLARLSRRAARRR